MAIVSNDEGRWQGVVCKIVCPHTLSSSQSYSRSTVTTPNMQPSVMFLPLFRCTGNSPVTKVPGEKNGYAYVSGHLLSLRGKCTLHGKAVCSVVHETDEAYTLYLLLEANVMAKDSF